MKTKISPILDAKELATLISSDNLFLIDASNYDDYSQNHIERAIFLDLNTQLSEIKEDFANGGRHPLPTLNTFLETLATNGITLEQHIVIYDRQNAANAAARLWWMLLSVGFTKVQVLNGGFQAAVLVGLPISNREEKKTKAAEKIRTKNWKLPIINLEEMEKATLDVNRTIIDVRSTERYNGFSEPIDLVAGHIPSAVNVPFTENLEENGLFLAPELLRLKYQSLTANNENTIVYCGSGVTACHTLLAFAYSGLEIPKLYVGSWSEWSRNEKIIATKK